MHLGRGVPWRPLLTQHAQSAIASSESEIRSIVRGEIGRHAALLDLAVAQATARPRALPGARFHPLLYRRNF